MITTIFGGPVATVRYATRDDVIRFEGMPPDTEARSAIKDRSWVVVTRPDGSEYLTNIAKLRADDGLREITEACIAGTSKLIESEAK
jgi:hypothetical protein